MTEALKPCPFCGGKAEFNSDEFGEGVYCKSCGATLHNGVYGEYGRKLASAEWNTRPIENKLEEEIKRLREALEHVVTTDTTVDKWGIWRIDGKTFQTWAADALKGNEK